MAKATREVLDDAVKSEFLIGRIYKTDIAL